MNIYTYLLIGLITGTLVFKYLGKFDLWPSIKFSFLSYILAWGVYFVLILFSGLASFVLIFLGISPDWLDAIPNHKWIIQGICDLIIILSMIGSNSEETGKRSNSTTSDKKNMSKKSYVILPPSRPTAVATPKNARPNSRKNLTNITNDIRKGLNLTISFRDFCDTDLYDLATLAGKFGTKLNMINSDMVSVRQLANIVQNCHGYVYADRIVEAGLDAELLAEKGVCFTCDCKNRSTSIKYIVEKSKKANGKLVLINCRHLSSREIEELRSIGKDNLEIK